MLSALNLMILRLDKGSVEDFADLGLLGQILVNSLRDLQRERHQNLDSMSKMGCIMLLA